MENYQIIEEIGRGTFGVVWKALNLQTREVFAIKKLMIKYGSWDECWNLREVRAHVKMDNHPNIVNVKEIFYESGFLFMVFEYMEGNLSQLMEQQQDEQLSETKTREMCFQLFQGLAHMHGKGYFHRDLKPDNILVNQDVIKIGDLGSAREMNDCVYTDYVTTRWYRAPEALLGSRMYDYAIDMWAMGAIMAELFTHKPLFQGNSEAAMMYKICSVLGTPTESTWCGGLYLAGMINYRFPEFHGMQFSDILPTASPDLVNLVSGLLSWNLCKRPTAMEALQHPFFNS
nr:cyclin-dependent kinase F-4-like [Tanacetum cinerariifolium]